MALQKKGGAVGAAAVTGNQTFIKILALDNFVSGGGIPAGDYCLKLKGELHYMTDKATGNRVGEPKIGVMIRAYLLSDPKADPKSQHYSFGSNAHKSIMVYPGTGPNDPTAGMKFCAIPGAPAAQMFKDTAWHVFVRELTNAGLPPEIDANDLTQIDGMWVTLGPVAEPDSWSRMPALGSTSETSSGKAKREPGTIACVSQILPGGAPWEGGGGIPKEPIIMDKSARPAATKLPVATVAAKAAAPAQVPASTGDTAMDDLMAAAREGIIKVLEVPENANGTQKVTVRMGVINYVDATYGEDAAQAVTASILDDITVFNTLLGEQGYTIKDKSMRVSLIQA